MANDEISNIPVVVFIADDYYAMPTAAAIASVIANFDSRRRLQVFIVDAGISEKNQYKIRSLAVPERVSIDWLRPSESLQRLIKSFPHGYVGRTCYYKMFIPDILGPRYPRMIYLDSDVIVEADITDLWDADPGVDYVLAAQDIINPYVSAPFGLRNWRELNRNSDDAILNSGVLIINAAKWHKEKVSCRLVEYINDHSRHIQLCDQDAMNAVFMNKWGRIDASWNVLPYMYKFRNYSLLDKNGHENLLMHARIIHYCGKDKPWKGRCQHIRKDRFMNYLEMTAWAGWRPKPWPDKYIFLYYIRRVQAILAGKLRSFLK